VTPEQSNQLAEEGYVVVPDVVPTALTDAAVHAIRRRCESLYSLYPDELTAALQRGLFPLWNARELWAIRGFPQVRQLFSALGNAGPMWSSFDRCGYRPEGHPSSQGLPPHWDDDFTRWDFAAFQGVIALLPSIRGDGEFICYPSAYRAYRAQGKTSAERENNSRELSPTHVELPQGAVLIFDYRLLHGTAQHHGSNPRAVQYVTYVPSSGRVERQRRVECWKRGTWRGTTKDPTYTVPDEKRPPLTPDGLMALLGPGAKK
jgi:Phytanoyl-CoA dioxygenase (PhyH)